MRPDTHEPATKGDLGLLKGDISLLKDDVGSLKGDVSSLKDEFMAFRAEMRDMFRPVLLTLEHHTAELADIRETFRPIHIALAHHTAELADIRGYLKDKMVTRDEFHSRMDGFTGRVDDFDYSSAKNRARLDEHEKRISALETKHA
ncbi:MAG: hypothetical protein A2V88_03715 [Elusimicrobia bacterium RBG_16_66_12]|nr:MAG: hypothetical protein A2V88_03715 [Elusimicrobia bacterium RBG_16_66_12]